MDTNSYGFYFLNASLQIKPDSFVYKLIPPTLKGYKKFVEGKISSFRMKRQFNSFDVTMPVLSSSYFSTSDEIELKKDVENPLKFETKEAVIEDIDHLKFEIKFIEKKYPNTMVLFNSNKNEAFRLMVAQSVDRDIRRMTHPRIMDRLRLETILSNYLQYIDKPYRQEINKLDVFLNSHPTNTEALNSKGLLLSELSEYNQAIECFGKAIEQDDYYECALDNLAITLRKLNKEMNSERNVQEK